MTKTNKIDVKNAETKKADIKELKEKIAQIKDGSKNKKSGDTISFEGELLSKLSSQYEDIKDIIPSGITLDKMVQRVNKVIDDNPKLMGCSVDSLVGAMVNCVGLGLEPNSLGHAFIVPHYNTVTKKVEAQFQLGYKGALTLARKTGEVKAIYAHAVYEGDEFEYSYGLEKNIVHKPCGEVSEDKVTHFYACYKLKDDAYDFIVMTRKEVEEHRDKFTRSKDGKGNIHGPWKDHFVSMGLKTALLKLIKYMPLAIENPYDEKVAYALYNDNTVKVMGN